MYAIKRYQRAINSNISNNGSLVSISCISGTFLTRVRQGMVLFLPIGINTLVVNWHIQIESTQLNGKRNSRIISYEMKGCLNNLSMMGGELR